MTETLTSLFGIEPVILCILLIPAGVMLARFAPPDTFEMAPPRHGGPMSHRSLLSLVLLGVIGFLIVRGGSPIGLHGDSWSDANVVVSGRNYARMGLFSNYGAAQHQVVSDRHVNDPYHVYTNYPVGPNLINGLWQSMGVRSERVFRLLPGACSVVAVMIWPRIYSRFVPLPVAQWAAIFMASSFAFLSLADALHFHAYAQFTSALAILFFLRVVQPSTPTAPRSLFLCALWVFVTALFTWEYHLFLLVFFLLYHRFFCGAFHVRRVLLLSLPLAAALVLQLLQRRLALASLLPAGVLDTSSTTFLHDIYRRTFGFHLGSDTPRGLTLMGYPAHVAFAFYKYYGLPVLVVMALTLTVLRARKDAGWGWGNWSAGGRLLIILIAAAMAWPCIMLQHTSVHAHVMRQGLPAYALLMALVFQRCVRLATDRARGWTVRVAAIATTLALLYPLVEGAVCSVRQHTVRNFRDPRGRSDAGSEEVRVLSRLARTLSSDAILFTNYSRVPLLRYWTGRPAYMASAARYPRGSPNARIRFEMCVKHVRELYRGKPPPLVYLYRQADRSVMACFNGDPYLRAFVAGTTLNGPEVQRRAQSIFSEVAKTGRSDHSYCPIMSKVGAIICFRMEPILPTVEKQFGDLPPPTLREYGAPP